MQEGKVSPKISRLSWGSIKVEGGKSFKDAKLYPGGAREWNWRETGTRHVPGVQHTDVQELVDHGARVIVLSKGINSQLEIKPETLRMLKEQGIEYHQLQTEDAVALYNELREHQQVGGLFHSTC